MVILPKARTRNRKIKDKKERQLQTALHYTPAHQPLGKWREGKEKLAWQLRSTQTQLISFLHFLLLIRNLENIIKLFEGNADKLFDWFSKNYFKANSGKCHLLVNTTSKVRISVKKEKISNSSNQKLLGVRFSSYFRFDDHVVSLFKKASQKLNGLTRVAQIINLSARRSTMETLICYQFE